MKGSFPLSLSSNPVSLWKSTQILTPTTLIRCSKALSHDTLVILFSSCNMTYLTDKCTSSSWYTRCVFMTVVFTQNAIVTRCTSDYTVAKVTRRAETTTVTSLWIKEKTKSHMFFKDLLMNILKAHETYGNCQKPVFSLVYPNMCIK